MNVNVSTSISLVDAAIMMAERYPSSCARCHPNACSEANNMIWRIDRGDPHFNKAWTHRLNIPSNFRILEPLIGPWSSTKVNYTDKSYLSALYPFSPAPPYRTAAMSGSFYSGSGISLRYAQTLKTFCTSTSILTKSSPPSSLATMKV
jgi:hypothetical protein